MSDVAAYHVLVCASFPVHICELSTHHGLFQQSDKNSICQTFPYKRNHTSHSIAASPIQPAYHQITNKHKLSAFVDI